MLGGLREIGSAVPAATGPGRPEGPVAAVAVLERMPGRRWWGGGCSEWRWQRRELGGEAVCQEGGGPSYTLGRQVGGQRVSYGGGADVSLQPGRDARRQVGRVAGGEEQAGVVSAQVGEEIGGRLEKGRGGAGGLRYGGEGLVAERRSLLGGLSRMGRP